jgi:hypothetical protein
MAGRHAAATSAAANETVIVRILFMVFLPELVENYEYLQSTARTITYGFLKPS